VEIDESEKRIQKTVKIFAHYCSEQSEVRAIRNTKLKK
jgi:hypothetical protein